MNYLELCQTFARETGISTSGPSSVTGQIGEFISVIDWVQQAYIDIQLRHPWKWLRREFTLQTTDGDGVYAFSDCTDADGTLTRFDRWLINDLHDPPKIYQGSAAGETFLSYVDHADFRVVYQIGAQRTNESQPIHITADEQDRLLLGPIPNGQYTVTGWYFRSPQVLAENDDVPEMPAHFHRLIVLYALEHYGYKYVAQEALERSFRQGRRMLRQLEATQAPRIRLCGPLV